MHYCNDTKTTFCRKGRAVNWGIKTFLCVFVEQIRNTKHFCGKGGGEILLLAGSGK